MNEDGLSLPQESGLAGFYLATVLANHSDSDKGTLKVRLLNEGSGKNIVEGVKVVVPFAGAEYGVYALPEVGEQVLVGFLGGCYDRPFALGSLFTASDKMVQNCSDKSNAIKRLVTKGGSVLEIYDQSGEEKITVRTPQKLSLALEQKSKTVTLTATDAKIVLDGDKGTVLVEGKQEIAFQSGNAKLQLRSDGTIKLQGTNVEINGNAVKIEGKGSVAVKGQKCDLSGSMVDVKSQGILSLKGNVTKIN